MDKVLEQNILFLPLLSRIYVTEKFPYILTDNKALELKKIIPKDFKCISKLVQYTHLSGAIRERKIDQKIDDFLALNPNGVIVELGCRLTTAIYRSGTNNKWYEVDDSDIIILKKKLFKPPKNDIYVESNIFDYKWLEQIKNENPQSPILIISSGLFYYYEKEKIINLLKTISRANNIELIFDAVNSIGKRRMSKYYNYLNIKDYTKMFCINNPHDLELEINHSVLLDNETFFENIPKVKFNPITRIYMRIADALKMINIFHIKTEHYS